MQNSKLKIDRIVFWEPSLSPHKIDLINEIKRIRPHYEVLYISANGISEERKKLGWTESGYEDCLVQPSFDTIEKLFSSNTPNTIHIFSGFKGGKTFQHALKMLKKYQAKFYILSEPRANEGVKGFLRYLDSIFFELWYKNNVRGVFAIGANGPIWFKKVGYKNYKLRLFAYFIDNKKFKNIERKQTDNITVGFIGRTVASKGILDFIETAKMMPEVNFKIVGASHILHELIDSSNSFNNIDFLGSIDMADIPDIMNEFDIIVSPSTTTDDGWGMVVSEALMAGCYIVTTNKVGSSILIFRDEIGEIVPIKDPYNIRNAIQQAIDNNFLNINYRKKRKDWALRNLGADNGAQYLIDVIERNRSDCFFDKIF